MSLASEDRVAILELVATCCHALDSGDVAAVVTTFAADGSFEVPGATYAGTDELERFFAANVEKDDNERHFTSNHLIQGDGEHATHRCYYQVVWRAGQGTKATGLYEDELSKVGESWRFKRRKVMPDSLRRGV